MGTDALKEAKVCPNHSPKDSGDLADQSTLQTLERSAEEGLDAFAWELEF